MEQRYDTVMAVMQGGFTVTEAAQKFGVSRESVYVTRSKVPQFTPSCRLSNLENHDGTYNGRRGLAPVSSFCPE
jgi:hypothetical protein